MTEKAIIITTLGVIVIFLCLCAFYIGLIVRTYNITSRKISPNNKLKILHITDLHSCIYGKNQSKLIDKIEKISPDIICMSGDIVDDRKSVAGTVSMLEGIKKYPCFYVIGNHETRTDNIDRVIDVFEKYGVCVLSEITGKLIESVNINGEKITVCGIDDPEYRSLKKTGRQISRVNKIISENKNFTILLSHRPELLEEYSKTSFDLVMSGHAHGGQWRLPYLINGVYAPHQGMFPKYAGGMYKLNDTVTLVVSRGLAIHNPIPRIFNPPELILVEVEHEK